MQRFFMYVVVFWAVVCPVTNGCASHGISINGDLKYPPDFHRFEYTSEHAVKGGSIVLHELGSFDKMNPYTLKGASPFGIDSLVYEPLAAASLDEPFAKYGLIAKDITVAEDKLSMVFTIDENARFSDGTPVTVEDVKFSLELFKSDKVHPHFPSYFRDIVDADILDKQRIRFNFSQINRELPLISCSLPILSHKFYEKHSFGTGDTLIKPVGSGPYVVESMKFGSSITFRLNKEYWARDRGVRRGMFNFERIKVEYYRDQIVSVEAFKAGEYDAMLVNIAKQWARDMVGDKFDNGTIIKKRFPHGNNAGMQGFVLNTRRSLFKDWRVRKALGLAFNFEWTNKALFYNQYTRSNSFFSNSYLKAEGVPTGLELEYLEPFRENLPLEVFTTPLAPPVNRNLESLREHLKQAQKLFAEAGWKVSDGVLKNRDGKVFEFEVLLASPSFERVFGPYAQNLKRLGIKINYRKIDPALYIERRQNFDFDMIVHVYGQSLSPGNEQRTFWHSTVANQRGARNYAGIESPAVDHLVEKIIYATTQEELTAACKALDRVLWYGYYVIPNWYLDVHRLVFYNKFNQPEKLPKYYDHFDYFMTWWSNSRDNLPVQ